MHDKTEEIEISMMLNGKDRNMSQAEKICRQLIVKGKWTKANCVLCRKLHKENCTVLNKVEREKLK